MMAGEAAKPKVAEKRKRGPKPGSPRVGGRQKGTPNKLTAAAKDAIAQAFEQLGGVEALVSWAQEDDDYRKVFYSQIWTKIVPLQVGGDPDGAPLKFQQIALVGIPASA